MKQIRKRLTYANMLSSLAIFLVLGGATAVAASQLAKNSVGSKQLKKNAVTAAKIKKGAVTGAKIKDGTIAGAKIDLAKLGTVPSAAKAASADAAAVAGSLTGQTTFSVRLGFGQQRIVATNGAVSLVANCRQEFGEDVAEVLFQTSVNRAVAGGSDNYNGSSAVSFLQTDSPAIDRQLAASFAEAGETQVSTEADEGFVLGPDGKGLVANSDGLVLGINYPSPGCLIGGVVNAIG